MLHKPASILTLKVPRQINKIYFLSIADGHRIFLLDHPFTEILFQVNGGTNDFFFFVKRLNQIQGGLLSHLQPNSLFNGEIKLMSVLLYVCRKRQRLCNYNLLSRSLILTNCNHYNFHELCPGRCHFLR